MFIVNRQGFKVYTETCDSLILEPLAFADRAFDSFLSHRWHVTQAEKRYLYYLMYRDLLFPEVSKVMRVLDIGGGITALTKILASRCYYSLIDPGVCQNDLTNAGLGMLEVLYSIDWAAIAPVPGPYDQVLSNDLFPNVDQRLELFLETYLPICRCMRLLLTIYDQPRYYRVQRLDADEQLTVLAWNAEQLCAVLYKYKSRIIPDAGGITDLDTLLRIPKEETLFANGRKIVIVNLRGDVK